MLKLSEREKINHFVRNLEAVAEMGDLVELNKKVQKVKHDKKFKEWCVRTFDSGNIKVDALFDYFK